MISIKCEILDSAAVNSALASFGRNLTERLENFLKREGAAMEKEIKQSLSVSARAGKGPRGGKLYEPSAPGEPPRLRTGNLRAAQGYKVAVNKSTGDFILDVGGVRGGGDEVKYQQDLELGRSNMAPRPHLMPVVMAHVVNWPKEFKVVVVEAKPKKP